jgi:CTP synthase (UTP-ammonia lyase)
LNQSLRVGTIGDLSPNHQSRIAADNALHHAARVLAVTVEPTWLPTQSLDREFGKLKQFDALCAPGGLYNSVSGGLKAIRFAREEGWPFIGT